MGAGPAREREQSSRQDSRDLYCSGGRSFVSETRCNGGAFRDRSSRPWPLLVWPSLAKQLPPGTTIAPLTRQRHRHGSEHRLDLSTKCGLWRRISQGAPGSGVPVQDRVWPGMAKAVRRPTEPTGMMRWTPLANTASRCAKIELPKPIDYKRCPHERYLDRD